MPMRDAVALLSDGRTAVGLVRLASLRSGEWVLEHAAAAHAAIEGRETIGKTLLVARR
ncbi:MAG: hypothetical protein M3065_01080 [Actinomycetota bacterium]|nr:hypothetical protein [Actinomycetota bacterium]